MTNLHHHTTLTTGSEFPVAFASAFHTNKHRSWGGGIVSTNVKHFNPKNSHVRQSHQMMAATSPLNYGSFGTDLTSFQSTQLIGANDAPTSTQVFEAVAPDPSLLIGMGSVVLLCIVAGFVWANEVVPVSRTKLAISKSRGEVRDYLDGLKTTNSTEAVSSNATMVSVLDTAIDSGEIRPNVGDGRDFERWLFSDWLNKQGTKGGRQKEPALPVLKDAKWNSGDNPVLVTSAIMMVGVILASVTERITTI